MSTVFGVPPPPRPYVVENASGSARKRANTRDAEPWRRRLVLLLAVLAAMTFLLANAATWLHFRGLNAEASAGPAAAASIEHARDQAREVAVPILLSQVEVFYASVQQPPPPTATEAVEASIEKAVQSPEFSELWESSVQQALEIEIAAVDQGGNPSTGTGTEATSGVIAVDLTVVAPVANQAMADAGYTFLAGEEGNLGQYNVPVAATDGLPYELLRALDTFWWALLLLAVGLGAAAVNLARRRLRLGAVLAVDVALVMAFTLLALRLYGTTVRDAADPRYQDIAEDAYRGITASLAVQTTVFLVIAIIAAVTCIVLARRQADTAAA
jgi:hypothetical protein